MGLQVGKHKERIVHYINYNMNGPSPKEDFPFNLKRSFIKRDSSSGSKRDSHNDRLMVGGAEHRTFREIHGTKEGIEALLIFRGWLDIL